MCDYLLPTVHCLQIFRPSRFMTPKNFGYGYSALVKINTFCFHFTTSSSNFWFRRNLHRYIMNPDFSECATEVQYLFFYIFVHIITVACTFILYHF